MITKHHSHHARVTVSGHAPAIDSAVIDALYGLEPVYDPATRSGAPLSSFVTVACPHCWRSQTIELDLSSGARTFMEDCRVCCQSMEIVISVNAKGDVDQVEVERLH